MASVNEQFQIGQKVCVKESGSKCYVALASDDQAGLIIAEVSAEYIVFEDDAAGIKMRIPTYLIRQGEVPPQNVPAAA
jgi:hypothetical protein